VLNLSGVTRVTPYALVGVVLWVCVLKSGVHATLAGVALAMAIPLRARDAQGRVPLRRMEHALHPWVAFFVLPVFGFANAGLNLGDVSFAALAAPIPLGVALGLFVGKQIGVFGGVWLAVRLGLARLPERADWTMVYGICLLTGIGFTMSLFIGGLAFDDVAHIGMVKLGVLVGSILSGVLGYAVLRVAISRRTPG
jgi:NhaA family Na+:H+ antiporter